MASSGKCYSVDRSVRRALASSLLSLLLVTSLVWGGCISCEQYFMWPGVKSCCTPGGHCKTKQSPAKKDSGPECKQLAFEDHKSLDHHFDLPAVDTAAVPVAQPVLATEAVAHRPSLELLAASPPDLQILHSTFRI